MTGLIINKGAGLRSTSKRISNSYLIFNETVNVRHQFLLHCIFYPPYLCQYSIEVEGID